jgi:hypothetical protein
MYKMLRTRALARLGTLGRENKKALSLALMGVVFAARKGLQIDFCRLVFSVLDIKNGMFWRSKTIIFLRTTQTYSVCMKILF